MGIAVRAATADDMDRVRHVDERAFGFGFTDAEWATVRPTLDPARFWLAYDGDELVGVCGSFGFDVTLPGGASVPMGGLTWVSVAATHRRRGVLRQMMDATHADIDRRGEPLAMLGASEGGIYERFGYGVVSWGRMVEVQMRTARLRGGVAPDPLGVRFIDGDAVRPHVESVWDRARRVRPAEVTRSAVWWDDVLSGWATADGGASAAYVLAHADGYAAYRVTQQWNLGLPAHEVTLEQVVAVTAEAHAALWSVLLSLDLVAVIRTRAMPIDDALPWLLDNARAVRTTALTDHQWANVRDPATVFSARTYGTTDRLVVEADGTRWAIDGGPDGGNCRRVRSKPDLVADHAALGSLLFGGVSASQLAAGRRLRGTADALRRADAFFHASPAPFGATFY